MNIEGDRVTVEIDFTNESSPEFVDPCARR
jgi:hypothetical protein